MPKSYWRVHHDLRSERGKASSHTCKCGKPAADWAYLRNGEGLISTYGTGIGQYYSEDIWNDYEPMCRRCHARFDRPEGVKPACLNTPEALEKMRRKIQESTSKRGSAVTNSMRWKCLECGTVSTPGPLTLHQAKLNHEGTEVV